MSQRPCLICNHSFSKLLYDCKTCNSNQLHTQMIKSKGIKTGIILRVTLLLITILMSQNLTMAQSNEDCFMCHEDPELTAMRNGRTVSMHIRTNALENSVHNDFDCTYCHEDAAVEEFPHPEKLQAVNCGNCHDEAMEKFDRGIHGQALRLKEIYAPNCNECHGSHNILKGSNPKSSTYKMNIPILCGKCHREGAPVARVYDIGEQNILENYSQDIHGIGLFEKGLIVSATCNDCHGNHEVLPHSSINSSISAKNIASTCMKCHTKIEEVHVQVIRGELWEEKPGAIPACSSCHIPHKVSKHNVTPNIADKSCLVCHEKDDVHKVVADSTISLVVNKEDLDNSVHQNISCVKCHSDVTSNRRRPCETVGPVNCSNCHAETSKLFSESGHGKALEADHPNAPYCTDCHGTHKAQSRYDDTSPTYRTNIPDLCGDCHYNDGKANEFADLAEKDALPDYSSSIHGKGLSEKGLIVSAVCTDCHSTHYILGEEDERSSIFPKNIPATCSTCHKGVYDTYILSDHGIGNAAPTDGEHEYPTCVNCHSSHFIGASGPDHFKEEITQRCEQCHEETAETYLDTYHGKAHLLGHAKAARCSDCHGDHNIYNMNNPKSMVASQNIVETCRQCHPDANARFTGYLTHATHHNKEKHSALYYTFWAMTFLLTGVFVFFGIHLLLWIPRSIQGRRERKKHEQQPKGLTSKYYIQRFSRNQRGTHIFVIISFLLLAFTGMILKFANMEWASTLAGWIGGIEVTGRLHRLGAVITFGYFFFHLISLIIIKRKRKIPSKRFIFGPNSLMFNLTDIKDFVATIKWFVGRGPKPEYGRWTYWEKFDYMAVFWGVAVIGISGLMLWFPEQFTLVFPGWLINIAQIIHSDEALLAVGFIFTIHFFNTHLRPETFPMDTVIFTGLVPFEEFRKDRPREYKYLKESGRLKKVLIKKDELNTGREKLIRLMGFIFVALGLTMVGLIIYSVLIGYV
mgnify:CR=1 FL=1|jgi:cytochrome b subunit of formate dehydrogenase